MKRIPSRSIAAVSALIALGSAFAARRPRYGGELRVEIRAVSQTLDPMFQPAVFETLVRFDDHGEPQPWLATSWTHDTARKR
jgi:ABC-type transport system substrate-binding protein